MEVADPLNELDDDLSGDESEQSELSTPEDRLPPTVSLSFVS